MLVTCYLSGKNYGRYVFPGHHNKCRNVWEEKEKKKPRSERSPVPAGPPHLVQVLAGSAGEEGLELYNQRALAVWNKEVLEECRHCARFLPLLVSTIRLPKWLSSPPVLTNLPFLPPLDLGTTCTGGGVEGVCHTQARCNILGLTMAGHCTRDKSVCCTEVSSCNTTLSSQVSYFTSNNSQQHRTGCQARILVNNRLCYIRLELQQFSFPAGERSGDCRTGKMTISSVVGGREETMQDICGHKEGMEVLVPVHGLQAVVLSAHLPPHTRAEWRVKTTQEKCSNISRRILNIRESMSSCSKRKETRRKVKSLLRRMKKQLFGQRKRRKKSKRPKRSPMFPLLDWMLREGERRRWRKEKEKVKVKEETPKVNIVLETASKKVKDVPSDFFQVVTASGLDLSEFSEHSIGDIHNSDTGGSIDDIHNNDTGDSAGDIPNTVESERVQSSERERRNYKRHNSLFSREKNSPAWVGKVVDNDDCPAYLISSNHVVTRSECVSSHSLTVIFSPSRVAVTSVTLHPVLHIALLTLNKELKYNTLCHPEEFIQTLIPSESDTRHYRSLKIKDWLEQAVVGQEEAL